MNRRVLSLLVLAYLGCGRATPSPVLEEPPEAIGADFSQLPELLAGIHMDATTTFAEGLPGEFWEPESRERELKDKPTVHWNGHALYTETLPIAEGDARKLTLLLASPESFEPLTAGKLCGDFQADYGVEWKTGEVLTRALVSLECGEARIYGPSGALSCDLAGPAAAQLKELLGRYQKNRPPATD